MCFRQWDPAGGASLAVPFLESRINDRHANSTAASGSGGHTLYAASITTGGSRDRSTTRERAFRLNAPTMKCRIGDGGSISNAGSPWECLCENYNSHLSARFCLFPFRLSTLICIRCPYEGMAVPCPYSINGWLCRPKLLPAGRRRSRGWRVQHAARTTFAWAVTPQHIASGRLAVPGVAGSAC
jgi:hypothetical protein